MKIAKGFIGVPLMLLSAVLVVALMVVYIVLFPVGVLLPSVHCTSMCPLYSTAHNSRCPSCSPYGIMIYRHGSCR